MKIGLIDVDGHNFPNLALMKLSAWHKAQGDDVSWWWGFDHYDRVYMSKVFGPDISPEPDEPVNADEIVKGGTGWGLDNRLPDEVEHAYPDYGLYPELCRDTAYGFLSRGCPRGCPFCIVAEKEGKRSVKVANLSEFWRGQKNIVLMDPNLLACPQREELLVQLIDSKAAVDVNQGFDARLMTDDVADMVRRMRMTELHFAWDNPRDEKAVLKGLETWLRKGKRVGRRHGTVYVLVNYNTTQDEDLHRIYTIRDMGYDPYVIIYDKAHAAQTVRDMARWVDNKWVFGRVKRFEDYKGGKTDDAG